jgi:hypothetical protein
MMLRSILLALLAVGGHAFTVISTVNAPARAAVSMMAAKGFGAPKVEPKKKKVVQKSAGSVKRDKAAADFDKLKAQGSPEYMVLVREVEDGGEPSKWYPVGGIAVPRSSSEDVALSLAIFNNEDDLLKGAFRAYPFLKKSEKKFEYGYRLKEFEDDPVKLANKEATEQSDNPIANWFNALDNPLNDGSGWGNPLKRN